MVCATGVAASAAASCLSPVHCGLLQTLWSRQCSQLLVPLLPLRSPSSCGDLGCQAPGACPWPSGFNEEPVATEGREEGVWAEPCARRRQAVGAKTLPAQDGCHPAVPREQMDDPSDSPWLLFAASTRGCRCLLAGSLDVPASTPCFPSLPARLAGSLLLPQMPGRAIGSVWPGAVRVGSGLGGSFTSKGTRRGRSPAGQDLQLGSAAPKGGDAPAHPPQCWLMVAWHPHVPAFPAFQRAIPAETDPGSSSAPFLIPRGPAAGAGTSEVFSPPSFTSFSSSALHPSWRLLLRNRLLVL